jgi:glycogen debranching enzyme
MLKEIIEEILESKIIDPKSIDADKIEDAGSFEDLKDMIRRKEIDFDKYYSVNDKLFRLLKAKDPENVEIVPIKHIKANYDWDLGKYILSYKDNEIPPKDVCKHIKKPLINPITKRPYVFYHGTNQNFDKFSDEFRGVNFGNLNQFKAHYFTTDKSYAEIYGKNIKRAILNIKKFYYPKIMINYTRNG